MENYTTLDPITGFLYEQPGKQLVIEVFVNGRYNGQQIWRVVEQEVPNDPMPPIRKKTLVGEFLKP